MLSRLLVSLRLAPLSPLNWLWQAIIKKKNSGCSGSFRGADAHSGRAGKGDIQLKFYCSSATPGLACGSWSLSSEDARMNCLWYFLPEGCLSVLVRGWLLGKLPWAGSPTIRLCKCLLGAELHTRGSDRTPSLAKAQEGRQADTSRCPRVTKSQTQSQ